MHDQPRQHRISTPPTHPDRCHPPGGSPPNCTRAPPSTTDPATLERATTVLAEHVRTIVDSFPPLTPEQRDRIATLLRTGGNRR